jgi:hypothetical protein
MEHIESPGEGGRPFRGIVFAVPVGLVVWALLFCVVRRLWG